jgi:hypothetical protein
MESNRQIDVTIISVFMSVAALALMVSVIPVALPLRFFAIAGGILLGPGGLAYRWAVGCRWVECMAIGIGINLAILMTLALFPVYLHSWHPARFEALIPITTLLLSAALLFRSRSNRYSGTRRRSV